jgi:protein-disulfide isomerase
MSTHRTVTSRTLLFVGVLTALSVLSGCAAQPQSAPAASESVVITTGTVGAVDFTNGYITLGTGPTIVDSYFDLMCPYCQEFEAASGSYIADLVSSGAVTLRLHPMVFLDRLSMGTEYSTRATNALVGVAAASPDATLSYLQLLFENKPEENAVGLTDDELSSLAARATANSAQSVALEQVLTDRPYVAWSAANTAAAMGDNGITGADVTSVEHVPLTLVNGHSYTGALSDAAAFAAFLSAN